MSNLRKFWFLASPPTTAMMLWTSYESMCSDRMVRHLFLSALRTWNWTKLNRGTLARISGISSSAVFGFRRGIHQIESSDPTIC